MHNPAQPVEREAPARIQLQARRAATSHVRPSQVAHTSDAARSTAELFSANEAARKRGRLWHAWLERIAWSEDGSPNSVQLAEWARACGRRELDPREAEQFLRALAQPRLHAELSREQAAQRLGSSAGELVLLREHSFCFLRDSEQGRELVQGVFDRAVISRATGRAEIIDYKTERSAGDDPLAQREAAARYLPQMQLYRSALAMLEGLDEHWAGVADLQCAGAHASDHRLRPRAELACLGLGRAAGGAGRPEARVSAAARPVGLRTAALHAGGIPLHLNVEFEGGGGRAHQGEKD
jgi:ATP-dependent exoDNAse (exonuclease V) beta subunit